MQAEQIELHRIILGIDKQEHVVRAVDALRRMLKRNHEEEDYSIVVPLELIRQARETRRLFNIVLGSIAAISLLVGGIGIMNIMLRPRHAVRQGECAPPRHRAAVPDGNPVALHFRRCDRACFRRSDTNDYHGLYQCENRPDLSGLCRGVHGFGNRFGYLRNLSGPPGRNDGSD